MIGFETHQPNFARMSLRRKRPIIWADVNSHRAHCDAAAANAHAGMRGWALGDWLAYLASATFRPRPDLDLIYARMRFRDDYRFGWWVSRRSPRLFARALRQQIIWRARRRKITQNRFHAYFAMYGRFGSSLFRYDYRALKEIERAKITSSRKPRINWKRLLEYKITLAMNDFESCSE